MSKVLALFALALAASLATAWSNPSTDEKAMYGHEGPLEQNWLPREVAGWPAPFLADDPSTSVTHRVGLEDTFRLGPFVGTLSFWFFFMSATRALIRWVLYARRRK
jgi:hypothetical protein